MTICKSFKLEFLSLDSEAEARHFFTVFLDNSQLFDIATHIGAVTPIMKSLTDWYWVENTEKVNFTLSFGAGQPDNYGGNEACLVLGFTGGSYFFNDLKCYENHMYKFVCQSITYETTTTTLPPPSCKS